MKVAWSRKRSSNSALDLARNAGDFTHVDFRHRILRRSKRAWTPTRCSAILVRIRRAVDFVIAKVHTACAETASCSPGCTACRCALDRPGQQWGRAIGKTEALPQAVMVEVAPRTPSGVQQMATETSPPALPSITRSMSSLVMTARGAGTGMPTEVDS